MWTVDLHRHRPGAQNSHPTTSLAAERSVDLVRTMANAVTPVPKQYYHAEDDGQKGQTRFFVECFRHRHDGRVGNGGGGADDGRVTVAVRAAVTSKCRDRTNAEARTDGCLWLVPSAMAYPLVSRPSAQAMSAPERRVRPVSPVRERRVDTGRRSTARGARPSRTSLKPVELKDDRLRIPVAGRGGDHIEVGHYSSPVLGWQTQRDDLHTGGQMQAGRENAVHGRATPE